MTGACGIVHKLGYFCSEIAQRNKGPVNGSVCLVCMTGKVESIKMDGNHKSTSVQLDGELIQYVLDSKNAFSHRFSMTGIM